MDSAAEATTPPSNNNNNSKQSPHDGGALTSITDDGHGAFARNVRQWLEHSPVASTNGATMLRLLEKESERVAQAPSGNFAVLAYNTQLNEVYNIAADTMLSAMHRGIYHHHVNRDALGFHMATDEEEIQLAADPLDSDEEESVSSADEPMSNNKSNKAAAPQQPTASNNLDAKARKREDAKKRRLEDEQLLVKNGKVRDEKGNLLTTLGPFAPPRLTLRTVKPGHPIPSRRMLNQRTALEKEESSSSEDDIDEEEVENAAIAAASSTAGKDGQFDDANTVAQLVVFMTPLSMDSLKKVSESAKVKLTAGCSHDEAVSEIVKSAVKLGCEKACVLMDKNKMLDKVANHAHTTRTHILAQLATSIPSFLNSLPQDLLKLLGPTLGIPNDNASVPELWERIVAMGLCSVLTHLRPRPLKKIAQELNIQLIDSGSTEKHCEQIVFAAFPRERLRVKKSKSSKKAPVVSFAVNPNQVHCVGHMGCIVFVVQNVSCMRNDAERHYSPEFEYGGFRWSLLCMSNKDSLALYLCQQGTVHCKFLIAVANDKNNDETVYNEGTQRFSSASAENDWGFNNVAKFDQLLDPEAGFWNEAKDSITIDVGIVLVESKQSSSVITNNNPPKGSAAHHQKDVKNKKGAAAADKADDKERIVQSVANQLLESERLEALRKKIKQDLARVNKEEEKLRKEIVQRQQKGWTQINDSGNSERNRILRETTEKERREQQERSREQERIRQLHEQNNDIKRRIQELTEEQSELQTKRTNVSTEVKDLKKQLETGKVELPKVEAQVASLHSQSTEAAKRIAEKKKRLEELKAAIAAIPEPPRPPTPLPVVEPEMEPNEPSSSSIVENPSQKDEEIMRSVQASLAAIMDNW